MKRVIGSFLAAALIAGLAIIGTPAPASAGAEVCAGVGTAQLSSPVFYPLLGPPANGGFNMGYTVGLCTETANFFATGGYGGPLGGAHCGLSTGGGVANGHHSFSWIGAGSLLVVFGGVDGVVNASPNVLAGQSCTSGATNFLITGAAVLI
jgi:hypothetical protein